MIIGETGLRPKEVTGTNGLQVNDIHKDTKTLTARSLKGCNPRPPMPISDELLTALNKLRNKTQPKRHRPIIHREYSETLSNHFYDHKITFSEKTKRPNNNSNKTLRHPTLLHNKES